MPDPEEPRDKGRGKRPGSPEGELEGIERILGACLGGEYYLARAQAQSPDEMGRLKQLVAENKVDDHMIEQGAIHPLSRFAIFQACDQNGGQELLSDEDKERFGRMVDDILYRALLLYDKLPPAEQRALSVEAPEVDILRLLEFHNRGVIDRGRLLEAFQVVGGYRAALRCIETDFLKRQFGEG